MRHNPGRGIMGQFVKAGPIIVDRLKEGGLRRHLHPVERGHIKGAVAADVEIDSAGGDHFLGDGHGLALGQGRRIIDRRAVEAVALVDVEHGEALEEGYRFAVLFIPVRGGGKPSERGLIALLGHEPVGIDDGRAMLALADRPARAVRLAEGQPALRGKALLDHRAPQDQDIDARIAPSRQRIAWQGGDRAGVIRAPDAGARAPRLDPRQAPGLELGDDLRGDFVIKARAIRRGLGARHFFVGARPWRASLVRRALPWPASLVRRARP